MRDAWRGVAGGRRNSSREGDASGMHGAECVVCVCACVVCVYAFAFVYVCVSVVGVWEGTSWSAGGVLRAH